MTSDPILKFMSYTFASLIALLVLLGLGKMRMVHAFSPVVARGHGAI